MKTGPDIVTDGLVFGYDTHDYSRFYNGPATTNHLLSLTQSWGNTIRTNGKAVAGTEEVNIPTIGKRTVKYVEYYNNYNNGNDLGCCPNLFNYHSGGTVPLVGNQSYTYSIVYKHTGGYTHPNFLYRYRYKADNTYIGEGGLHSTARRTHLGDGWYHAWGSWTTDADANYGRFYSFLYNYGTDVERFYVAAISLVKNNSGATHLIIPPNLLLEPNTSISTTQSIIDLKKTTDINVANNSFDSTGQPTLDGTDDYIYPNNITNGSGLTSITAEFVVKASANNKNIIKSNSNAILLHYGGAGFYLNSTDNTTSGYLGWNGKLTGGTGVYEHLVATYDGTTMKLYVNGEPTGTTRAYSAGSTGVLKDLNGVVIGGYFNSTQPYFNGDMPIAKIYNKALPAEEVKQNFNAYRKRFEL
jgi:hypothetical protein